MKKNKAVKAARVQVDLMAARNAARPFSQGGIATEKNVENEVTTFRVVMDENTAANTPVTADPSMILRGDLEVSPTRPTFKIVVRPSLLIKTTGQDGPLLVDADANNMAPGSGEAVPTVGPTAQFDYEKIDKCLTGGKKCVCHASKPVDECAGQRTSLFATPDDPPSGVRLGLRFRNVPLRALTLRCSAPLRAAVARR